MSSDNFNNNYKKNTEVNNTYISNNEDKQLKNDFSFQTIIQFLIRRKKVIYLSFFIFLTALVSRSIYTRINSPIFKATFSLLIKDPINLSSQRKSFDKNIFEDLVSSDSNQDIASLIAFLKSPLVLSELNKKHDVSIASNLTITLGEGASEKRSMRDNIARGVLNFAYQDDNPEKAEKILKDVSQLYLKVAFDQNKTRISKVLEFLDQQEPLIKQSSILAQNELEEFRLKNNVVDPVSTLKFMKEKELELETKLSQAKSLYVPNSQIILSLEKQLGNLKENFSNKAIFIKDYEKIMQKIEISKENLSSLIFAKDKFQLEMAQNSMPWKIISEPVASNIPVYPNLKREFLKDLMLALVLSFTIGYLRERFDNVFHSSSELKQFINKPILESIPYFEIFQGVRENKMNLLDIIEFENEENKELGKFKRYEKFLYQESFRNLYTSIRFLSSDNLINTIVLTSSIPGEGKSTISLLIAKTIAQMDKKVLIIDGDLRKSQLHTRLGIDNFNGLSNLISDNGKEWRSSINEISNYKNLYAMTAGITPPDPTRLLSSRRMKEIITDIKESKEFDYIFFDAPPILGLSDVPLISNICDGTILLVSIENLNKSLLPQTLNKINENNINLLGLITNQTKQSSLIRKQGSYGYGYGYGYGDKAYMGYYSADDGDFKEEKDDENNEKSVKNFFNNQIKNIFLKKLKSFLFWLDN